MRALDRSTRPRIAITAWRRELPTYLGQRTPMDTLDPAYSARIADAGGLPLIVPRGPYPEEALAGMDGLMLTGGGDVDPATYGAADESSTDVDLEADAWELALLEEAMRRDLPTLAICRGAQLLAVAHGGHLIQHVEPDDLHPRVDGREPDVLRADRHPVALVEGSQVARVFGTATLTVNTLHHQAIADAGSLAVTARTESGIIEAIEPRDGWPALGVQWHPEKMHEAEQRRLFEHFVALAVGRRDASGATASEAPASDATGSPAAARP
jgi:putative glutamine amidotransferase